MNDCPGSDCIVRVRDSSRGSVPCSHIIWILHLPSWSGFSWVKRQMGFSSVPSEKLALIINLFPLTNPSFLNSMKPFTNPTSRMELRALIAGVTRRGWFTWNWFTCFYLSVCFLVIFMSLGSQGAILLPGLGSVLLMAGWYTVTLGVTRWSDWIAAGKPPQVSWGFWWGRNWMWERRRMCLSFNLRSSYSRSILLQGSTQLLIPRLCEEVMRILRGCVGHTSSHLGAHESVRQPSCCKASAV